MEGGKVTLHDILRGRKILEIPVYQRNYDWRVSHCMRLFNDIELACDARKDPTLHTTNPRHFLGSIVVEEGDEDTTKMKIIDGQQRITTLFLIVLSAYNIARECGESTDSGLVDFVLKPILKEEFYTEVGAEDTYKLVLNSKDQEAYIKLYGEEHRWDERSNITINYRKIHEMMKESRHTISEIMKALLDFEFMKIKLNPAHDDVQLIFETINSTGKGLTPADKIRNLLLMGLDTRVQELKYNSHWHPMECLFSNDIDIVNSFFKVYLNYKEARHSSSEDTYERYKRYAQGKDKEYLFDDMLEYAIAYKQAMSQETGNADIDSILYRMSVYCGGELLQIIGLILPMLRDLYVRELREEQVLAMLELFEVYLGRISLLPTTDYKAVKSVTSKIYDKVKETVEKGEGSEHMHIELGNHLASIRGKLTLPTDERLRVIFNTAEVGNVSLNKDPRKKYFFERIENGSHKERMYGMYEAISSNTYTIEHIMPKKINNRNNLWKNMLGDDWESIHEEYLNNVGNITITGYNSEMSNRDFLTKKTMAGGYNDSHFPRLNRVQKEVDVWNKDSILQRNNYLYELAKEIWAYPDYITYTGEEDVDNEVTLKDLEHYKGIRYRGYTYKGKSYAKGNWNDVTVNVFKQIVNTDPQKFYNMYEKQVEYKIKIMFNDEGEEVYGGIKVNTKLSAKDKIEILKILFNFYGEDPEDLVFTLEPK